MSCDFRIFFVVKGELRTRGHIGVKTRKKYRLGESYVALIPDGSLKGIIIVLLKWYVVICN